MMGEFRDLHVGGDWIIAADRIEEQIKWSQKNYHAACYFQRWGYDGKSVVTVVDLYDDRYPTVTITNDAEYVVRLAVQQQGNHPIIYRDTTGAWDELRHRDGHFATFRTLCTGEVDEAIRIVLALHERDAQSKGQPI